MWGMSQLATLHDCLVPPPPDEKEETTDERVTLRFTKPGTKAKLERICARHGVTVSLFLRQAGEKICDELGDA